MTVIRASIKVVGALFIPFLRRKKVNYGGKENRRNHCPEDGEREFKQNVTSCNKALSSLKSELGLVEAQYEGQQNSLEALTKKHSVLSRMLEEQKAKQEETVKGLEHARGEYEKVEKGIETLNKEQESHKKRLGRITTGISGCSKPDGEND